MSEDIIEPFVIPDIYADDIAMVELVGPNVRLTYFTWQEGQRVVVCRLVRPRESIRGMVRLLLEQALAAEGSGPPPMQIMN